MDSKQLFLNLHQIVHGSNLDITDELDFDKELLLHISRGSQNNSISHITLEYKSAKAKFFCCLTFDGSGDYGTGVHNFAMPRVKTTLNQKALGCLSVLDYLIANRFLDGCSFDYFKEKIAFEMGNTSLAQLSREYLDIYENSLRTISQFLTPHTAA